MNHRLAGEKPDHVIGGQHGEKHKDKHIHDIFNTPVKDTIPEKHRAIVTAAKTDSISVTFKALIEHKILSVPVYDPHTHSYIGFVDMVDMV